MSKYRLFFAVALAASFICPAAFADEPLDPARVKVSVSDSDAPQTVKTTDGRTLKLVWQDEFNGTGLPDASKWSYEVGYVRNNEQQYYTDARVENIFQKDGCLTIKTIKEKYPIEGKPGSQGKKEADYTSAAIETLGKVSWQYGRVEVRAQLPTGKGIWPAIWMMGDNIRRVGWPGCGEIDIMEYVGHTPRTSHGTIHMRRKGGERWQNVSKGNKVELDRPEEQFYVYTLEWTPEKMLILVDDQVVLEFNKAEEESKTSIWPFDQKFYIILNTAIGGSWGGEIADGICPTEFKIDYVRVYQ
ncbi:MAG: glycoside hydrolase family 16 protein [Thermoguttaceae bacterium]|nr:glycoside hydrolase family 16 protein [Thermoguttaceae bacterium]MBR4750843.1 glycoside hydrolase family 16 protein [Thermoguttaceae bacterium]